MLTRQWLPPRLWAVVLCVLEKVVAAELSRRFGWLVVVWWVCFGLVFGLVGSVVVGVVVQWLVEEIEGAPWSRSLWRRSYWLKKDALDMFYD